MWNQVIVLVLGRMWLHHESRKNCTKNMQPLPLDSVYWIDDQIWCQQIFEHRENTHLPYAVFKIIAVTLAVTCRLDIPVLLNTLNELCAGIAKLEYCSRS